MINFVLPLVLVMNPSQAPENKVLDLHDGIQSKKIEITANSTGGYSGDCILLKVNPISWKGDVLVPAGTHFLSQDEGEQDIFVVEDQMLALGSGKTNFTIKGYCSQKSNRAPDEGSAFKIKKTTNAQLKSLAEYINTSKPSENNFQEAVWSVSDRNGVSGIYAENAKDKALRNYICELTGQKDTWYTSQREYRLNEDRTIAIQPVKISGQIKFQLEKPGTVMYKLYRGEEKLFDVGGDRIFDQPGEYTFNFNVSVKSWKKGDYFFKVYFGEKVMHEETFEV